MYLSVYDGTEKVNIMLKQELKIQNKLLLFKGQSQKVVIDNNKTYKIEHKHGKLYNLNSDPADETCCYRALDNNNNSLSLWHLSLLSLWPFRL